MYVKSFNDSFIMPKKATDMAGAFDIFMPKEGRATRQPTVFNLGFATEIPEYHVALLLPRSKAGSKYGLELVNTVGVIDSDYRGEWKAALRVTACDSYQWAEKDRVLQFLIMPIASVQLREVDELNFTDRSKEGFGSTGV